MLSGTVTDREIEMVDNDDVGFTEERYVTAESNFRDCPGVGYRGRNARLNTPVDREAALNAFSASMVR